MSADQDKLAQAQATLQALGSLLRGLQDVASAASALSHQQREQAHDAEELGQRLRSMAEQLSRPTQQQERLRDALSRTQGDTLHSSDRQPHLELHDGGGQRPAADVTELRRQAALAAQTGLDLSASSAPDVGEQVLRVAQLCEAQGLLADEVMAGVLLGAARYGHSRQQPSPLHWPSMLDEAMRVLAEAHLRP